MARLDLYINYDLQASIKLADDDVVLGRDPDCAVQIPDPRVSRCHAIITRAGEGHCIRNVGRNGTRVNGQAIDAPRALLAGDAIFISSHILVYQDDDAAAVTPSETLYNIPPE